MDRQTLMRHLSQLGARVLQGATAAVDLPQGGHDAWKAGEGLAALGQAVRGPRCLRFCGVR
jgi:hypothetical protein